MKIDTRVWNTYVPGLPLGWRLPRLPGAPGVPEYDDLRLYSILLLYSLAYDEGLSEWVDDYIMLLLRYYINGLMDPDKINKFLKVWANWNKWTGE
jgi:hypothetical protein